MGEVKCVRVPVCPSVCLSVCSLLRYCLKEFLPPLPKVGRPIFLKILNPWGEKMERSGLRFEHFCSKMGLNRHCKKKFFLRIFFHLLTFEVPFKRLFAPTSQSWMSKFIRDSESLEKSIGKKWSHIWTFLLKNGLKSLRRKKFLRILSSFVHFWGTV